MKIYLIEISKYVICFFMICYTLFSFMTFLHKNESERIVVYISQNIFMLIVQAFCFIQIYAQKQDPVYIFYYIVQVIILMSAIVMYHTLYPDGNRLIINNMCMMLMLGMVMLIRIDMAKAQRQFIISACAIVLALIIPQLIYKWKFLNKLTFVYAISGIAILSIVLILGSVTNGSKITFSLAGVTFQPSEFVKILFVMFVAASLNESVSLRQIGITTLFAIMHVMILVLSKDLGSAVILFVVFVFMVFAATGNPLYLTGGTGLGIFGALAAYKLFTHVQFRVSAWLDPWSTIDSTGYQITQSLFGISSGGWFGLGLFGGNPESIPYVEDDFIFSAISEEMGLITSICLVLICLSTFIMFMYEAYYFRNIFNRLIAFGFGLSYIFQVFLTVGGGTKFIPLTGVTLPLVSYGGSSVMATIIMIAIFEGLCILHKQERYEAMMRHRSREKA